MGTWLGDHATFAIFANLLLPDRYTKSCSIDTVQDFLIETMYSFSGNKYFFHYIMSPSDQN